MSCLRQWGAAKGSGAWRQDMDKTAFWAIFEKTQNICGEKFCKKKKNRFSFISMSVGAVTKIKNL